LRRRVPIPPEAPVIKMRGISFLVISDQFAITCP